jgi:hypothetical protein
MGQLIGLIGIYDMEEWSSVIPVGSRYVWVRLIFAMRRQNSGQDFPSGWYVMSKQLPEILGIIVEFSLFTQTMSTLFLAGISNMGPGELQAMKDSSQVFLKYLTRPQ